LFNILQHVLHFCDRNEATKGTVSGGGGDDDGDDDDDGPTAMCEVIDFHV
jgi:hypothetical protein